MRIRLSHLRRIIRESLEEQGWAPGRWFPSEGEPLDAEELEDLGEAESEELVEGVSLTTSNLESVDWATIEKRFPEFARQVKNAYKADLKGASFALSKQGFFAKRVPLVAFDSRNMPVLYWDGGEVKSNNSASLGDAARKTK